MSIKVLAIDDSMTIRSMLSRILTEAGFELALAEDGVAGVEALDGFDADVVVTDVNMPRMDGFGVIEAVRAMDRHKTTPILVLTTETSGELRQKAKSLGATGWITKPFDADRLTAAIRRVAV